MFFGVNLLKNECSSIQIVLARMVTGFVFNSVFCEVNKIPVYSSDKSVFRLLVLRGFFGGSTIICVFACLTMMNISDAVVLINTNPIWTNFLAFFFLAEPFSKKSIFLCLLSFVGIILVCRPAILFNGNSNSDISQV